MTWEIGVSKGNWGQSKIITGLQAWWPCSMRNGVNRRLGGCHIESGFSSAEVIRS